MRLFQLFTYQCHVPILTDQAWHNVLQLFVALIAFPKFFFEKVNSEKIQQTTSIFEKLTSMQSVNFKEQKYIVLQNCALFL